MKKLIGCTHPLHRVINDCIELRVAGERPRPGYDRLVMNCLPVYHPEEVTRDGYRRILFVPLEGSELSFMFKEGKGDGSGNEAAVLTTTRVIDMLERYSTMDFRFVLSAGATRDVYWWKDGPLYFVFHNKVGSLAFETMLMPPKGGWPSIF